MTCPRLILGILLSGHIMAAAESSGWPQFLGPMRNGSAGDSCVALPEAFPKEPEVLWSRPLGSGHAGPVIAEEKLVMVHRQGDALVVDALDAKSGQPLWQQTFSTSYRDDFGMDEGPRAVPTIADGRVFVHGADGMLYALDLRKGTKLWEVDTAATLESPQGFFGRACSPLVAGEKVLVTTGGKAAMTAFAVESGRVIWSTGQDDASYASPVMLNETVVLAWLRNHLTTFSLSDGAVLDRQRYRPSMEASVSAATPVQTDAGWFLSAEYGVGCSLWSIQENGSLNQTWRADELLDAHFSTPVHRQGCVFGFHGRQERGMALRCLELKTKTVTWESPPTKGGTLLLVRDKLVVLTEEGELWVVRATPERFDQLLSMQVLRANHRSHAAYADGIWYARDSEKLVAIRLATP